MPLACEPAKVFRGEAGSVGVHGEDARLEKQTTWT